MPRPRFRSLVLTASGVIFVGGVAAAATGGGLTPLLDVGGDSSTTTTVTTTTLADTSFADGELGGWTQAELLQVCEDAANHGEAVSTVAKDPRSAGPDHGEIVSLMARSGCGKEDDETETEDETEIEDEQPPTTEADDEPAFTDEELQKICDEAANHGEAVSSVAKDPRTTGREHGQIVSMMAKSDCGKDGADEATAPTNANKSNKGKGKNKNGAAQGS